jgi:hypothetical protein
MNGTVERKQATATAGHGVRTASNARADLRRPSHGWPGNSPADLDRRLDEALMETFPASDPVSVVLCGRG